MEKLKNDIRDYQLNVGKAYMKYETDRYSQYQNYLYKRALYGLNALSEQELATMCSKKRQRVFNVYKRAQDVLNAFKQQVTIAKTNALFEALFPKSPITKFLLSETGLDEKFKNTLTFKDLGISKDQIISIFMEEGILPKNFLSLQSNPNELPKLRTT
jgi:predicted DNA-binding protein YlxM (UPF0122 family)